MKSVIIKATVGSINIWEVEIGTRKENQMYVNYYINCYSYFVKDIKQKMEYNRNIFNTAKYVYVKLYNSVNNLH